MQKTLSLHKRSRCTFMLALLAAVTLAPHAAWSEQWTRRYINSLPDAAFAAVERTPDGKKLRHLPHHDRSGRVDLAHARNALSRLSQVQWADAHRAAAAQAHLKRHLREDARARRRDRLN